MKPTNIISGIAISALALFIPLPEAQAAERGTINGYAADVVQSGSMRLPDLITVVGPYGTETITVTCAPYDWSSSGPNTAQWVDTITRSWCF